MTRNVTIRRHKTVEIFAYSTSLQKSVGTPHVSVCLHYNNALRRLEAQVSLFLQGR
jgi:hypothetical protein